MDTNGQFIDLIKSLFDHQGQQIDETPKDMYELDMKGVLHHSTGRIENFKNFHANKKANRSGRNRNLGIKENSLEQVLEKFAFLKGIPMTQFYSELTEKDRQLLGVLSVPQQFEKNNIRNLLFDISFVESGYHFLQKDKTLSRSLNGKTAVAFGDTITSALTDSWENINFADLVAYAYIIYSNAIVGVEKSTKSYTYAFDTTFLNPYNADDEINKTMKDELPTELYRNAIPFTPIHFDSEQQLSIPVTYVQILRFIEHKAEYMLRKYAEDLIINSIKSQNKSILVKEILTLIVDCSCDSIYLLLEQNSNLDAICEIKDKPLLTYLCKIVLLSKAQRLVEIFEADILDTYGEIDAYFEFTNMVENLIKSNSDKSAFENFNSIYSYKDERKDEYKQFLLDFYRAEGNTIELLNRYERIFANLSLYKERFNNASKKMNTLIENTNIDMNFYLYQIQIKNINSQNTQMAQQMALIKKELEKSNKRNINLKSELDEAKGKNKDLRAEIRDLQKNREVKSPSSTTKTAKDLQEKINIILTEKEQIENSFEQYKSEMEAQLNLKEHNNKKLCEQLNSIKSEKQAIEDKLKSINSTSLPLPPVQPLPSKTTEINIDTWLAQGAFLLNGSNRKDYEYAILNFVEANFDIKHLVEDETLKEIESYNSRIGYALIEDNKHFVVFANGEKKQIKNLPNDIYLGSFQFLKVDGEDNFVGTFPSIYRDRLKDKYHDFGIITSINDDEVVFTILNDEEIKVKNTPSEAKLKIGFKIGVGQAVSYNRISNTFMPYQMTPLSLDTFFKSIVAKNHRIVVFIKQLSNGGIFYDIDTESETFLSFSEEDVFKKWNLNDEQVVIFDNSNNRIVKVFQNPLFFKLSTFYKKSMLVTIESIESDNRIFIKNNIGEVVLLKKYPSHYKASIGDILLVDEDYSYLRNEDSNQKYLNNLSIERKVLSSPKNTSSKNKESKAVEITHKVLIFGNPSFSNNYQLALRKDGFDSTLIDGYDNPKKIMGSLNKFDLIIICNEFASHENMWEVKDWAKAKNKPVLYPKKDGANFISMEITSFISKTD
ncbi:DUF2325 domain-containing protein [Lysinibacillus sp. 1P01SD]|uniref:DUF2325 domain-containing protein n=1 Tax=Lysinibacillus sp. 1P01SD TaxID=3132285 RepID=UPI0039A15B97